MLASSLKPALIFAAAFAAVAHAEPPSLSGIYPHLAMFNDEGECGTGAVVPWAGSLWVVTYAPHSPQGSSDKLYQITPDLEQIIRPESIGGTPANRMIHDESGQLFIGPHAISKDGEVRTIPYSEMFGRPTGNARHLTDPAGKILCASMEEGIYEIDVRTLDVKELWGDEASRKSPRKANLPGYHGKGFYSGQGVYVYANNGDHASAARTDPTVPSGVLAEWDGRADKWNIVRRNQFTEVTGPGGIHGNAKPDTDPIWTIGWDSKSLLFGVRKPDAGWKFFRLPKGSHSYDGAHGWNTEWPRIREIGAGDYLMTMHGTFWNFPSSFGAPDFTGIRPRSNYLKVIGDFCLWKDRVVFGCDDTAKNEFLNKRKAKGEIAAPQSQSNLWFVEPGALDEIGPVIGRGAVWMKEDLAADAVSDPYLFAGYDKRGLFLAHESGSEVVFTLETGDGSGPWKPLSSETVPSGTGRFVAFPASAAGEWIRVRTGSSAKAATAVFTYRDKDPRDTVADEVFAGLAAPGEDRSGGILRARDGGIKTLSFAAETAAGKPAGYYELDGEMKLRRVEDAKIEEFTRSRAAIPTAALTRDAASAIYTDEDGSRWRLPVGGLSKAEAAATHRIVREVATERDLLNAEGTFYELPARNAGGIAKLRPIATHNRLIHDFCSFRGLFVLSGVATGAPADNPHIIRSDDGKVALWAGAIDDAWKLGKPRGDGGPWKETKVRAGEPSDPYLMTAYDEKSLQLTSDKDSTITVQVDVHGDGTWVDVMDLAVKAGKPLDHKFPDEFSAYWIRFASDKDAVVTAQLSYR